MNQPPSNLEARTTLCVSMYEHYNQLILSNSHRSIAELAFRIERRAHWEQAYLNLHPLDEIAHQIPITKIQSHGPASNFKN